MVATFEFYITVSDITAGTPEDVPVAQQASWPQRAKYFQVPWSASPTTRGDYSAVPLETSVSQLAAAFASFGAVYVSVMEGKWTP
jgi:hypothetical protein